MEMLNAFTKLSDAVNAKLDETIDPAEIINKELQGVVDFNLWLETVEIQKTFNDKVAPGWQLDLDNSKYNFWMAVLDETVEVLNSKHWKWWKNHEDMGKVDWDNIQVELIDLFHFILSLSIQHDLSNVIFTQLVNAELNYKEMYKHQDENYFNDFWEKFLMTVQMKNLVLVAIHWVEFWYRAGGTVERLFKEYRVKAALNNIRQEFGYNEKKYQKIWTDEHGNKVEDNVIAWKLAENLELNENTTKEMQQQLRDWYLKYVAI